MTRSGGDRLYALLLWMYPPAFRRTHGATMRQFARTAMSRGDIGAAALLFDTVRGAATEWMSLLPSRRQPGYPQTHTGEPMHTLFRDTAHAIRLMRKSPGFTLVAVLTLALGIGANTAIFTLAQATVLRPLHVHRPDQLFTIPWSSSYPDYEDYARRTDIFTGVAAVGGSSRASVAIDGNTELADTTFVSGNTFDVLGVRAAAGRTLLPSDDVPNGPLVGVIGHDYWRTRFGADPSVLGRLLRINGAPVTIVGVAEDGFRGTSLTSHPSIFVTLSSVPQIRTGMRSRVPFRTTRGFVWLTTIARLKDGVPLATAESQMNTLYRQQHPAGNERDVELLTLQPLGTRALGRDAAGTRRFVALLFGVVGLTLLIGCANLANLLLARAASRRSEMGVRLALGATRGRVIRQMLVESTLLSAAGGVAGIGVAALALELFSAYQLPGGLDLSKIRLEIDPAALAVTMALSVMTGLLFGAAPAWQAARTDVLTSLTAQSRSTTGRSHLRSVLLGAQVAMSLVLLTGTGLFARSLVSALRTPLGFDVANVATASVNLGLARYDAPRAEAFYATTLESVGSLPQVESVAWSTVVPTLGLRISDADIVGDGKTPPQSASVMVASVTPRYFQTVGMRLHEGRAFSADDAKGTRPVAIVNQTMARKYWQGRSPVGGRVTIFRGGEVHIIGVTDDAITREIGEAPAPYMYLAFSQWLDGPESVALDPAHLFVKLRTDTASGIPLVRDRLRALDPALPLYDVDALETRLRGLVMPQRMGVTLFALFSCLALALATVGIYGVARYIAATRTREIGIRMALGATRSGITRLVLLEGAWPVAAGIVAGLGVALYCARLVEAFLRGVTPFDAPTFVAVTVLVSGIAFVATYLPARRAARVEPVNALRTE